MMPDFKYVTELPEGERVVGLVNFQDRIIVATEKSLYELVGRSLEAIPFKLEKHTDTKEGAVNGGS